MHMYLHTHTCTHTHTQTHKHTNTHTHHTQKLSDVNAKALGHLRPVLEQSGRCAPALPSGVFADCFRHFGRQGARVFRGSEVKLVGPRPIDQSQNRCTKEECISLLSSRMTECSLDRSMQRIHWTVAAEAVNFPTLNSQKTLLAVLLMVAVVVVVAAAAEHQSVFNPLC